MSQLREIHWPEGPQSGDIHSEGGRTWEYTLLPPGSSVPGVWRDVGCKEVTSGPGWTLDDLKDWLGVETPDYDDQIIAAMKISIAFIERYCNRLFEYRLNHRERVYRQRSSGWQVHLWPIEGDVNVAGEEHTFEIDNQTGILWFENENVNHKMPNTLQYNGGYKPDEWPADLLMVLYNSVKNYWDVNIEGTGGNNVTKVTVPDVGTLTYGTSSNNSVNIGMGATFGPVNQSDQQLLDFYRLYEC